MRFISTLILTLILHIAAMNQPTLAGDYVSCKDGSNYKLPFRLDRPMDFCLNKFNMISAVGYITMKTPKKATSYWNEIRDLGYRPLGFTFHSPGGNLWGGMELGRRIRQANAETHVGRGSLCVSSCFLAYMGGRKRSITHNGGIGNHQWAGDSAYEKEAISQEIAGNMVLFLGKMGLSHTAIGLILKTPHDKMFWFDQLSKKQMRRHGITRR